MTRSESREQAFILIFEKEFNAEYSIDEIIEAAKDAELFETGNFARELSSKTLEKIDELDEIIIANLKGGWKINRISKVSLAILRLAVCEITEFDDIPISVSINEAVELSKKYASEDDSSFINGLLSSVSKSFKGNE